MTYTIDKEGISKMDYLSVGLKAGIWVGVLGILNLFTIFFLGAWVGPGLILYFILATILVYPLNRIARKRRENPTFEPITKKRMLFSKDTHLLLNGDELNFIDLQARLKFRIPREDLQKMDSILESELNDPTQSDRPRYFRAGFQK